MRRVIVILSLCILTSCIGSGLQNMLGERLAERESKKMLYIPDSYDPIETIVDSAILSTHNDPIILATAQELFEVRDQSSIFNLRDSYNKFEKLEQSIRERASKLESGKFFGWEVRHRFRATDNDGRVDILNMLYICDKRFKDNLITVSLDKNEDGNYADLIYIIDDITSNIDLDGGNDIVDWQLLDEWSDDISEMVDELESESLDIIEDVKSNTTKVIKNIKKETSSVRHDIETTYSDTVEDIKQIGEEVQGEAKDIINEVKAEIQEGFKGVKEFTPQETQEIDEAYNYDEYLEYESNDNTIDTNTIIELNGL